MGYWKGNVFRLEGRVIVEKGCGKEEVREL